MAQRYPQNELFRAARLRLPSPAGFGPMSREELADCANRYLSGRDGPITADDIGNIEQGRTSYPRLHRRAALRKALKVETDAEIGLFNRRRRASDQPRPSEPVDELRLALDRPDQWSAAANHSAGGEVPDEALWISADTAALISRFTRKDLSVHRRDAARTIAGILFGGALLAPLERWLLDESPSAIGTDRRHGFGRQEVEQVEMSARLFRSWDDRFGGGLRRKAVVGQLSEVSDMLIDAPVNPLTRRLYAAMAQLAGTAATLSWDSGQQQQAQGYYSLALRAAREADDRAFGANILAGMARQLFYLGHAADALELVRRAQSWSRGRVSSKVTAMPHTREAWAYALQGRISAFRDATVRAEDALARRFDGVILNPSEGFDPCLSGSA